MRSFSNRVAIVSGGRDAAKLNRAASQIDASGANVTAGRN